MPKSQVLPLGTRQVVSNEMIDALMQVGLSIDVVKTLGAKFVFREKTGKDPLEIAAIICSVSHQGGNLLLGVQNTLLAGGNKIECIAFDRHKGCWRADIKGLTHIVAYGTLEFLL